MAEWFETLLKIIGGCVVVYALGWKTLKYILDGYKQRALYKTLHRYFTRVELKKATRYYVHTKGQKKPPPKEPEPKHPHARAPRTKLIPFFVNKVFKQDIETKDRPFYIILAEPGMGKTTFMINLFLKYISQWFGKKYDIKLLPMGRPDMDKEIDNIEDEKKENMILLLDGLDEDTRAAVDFQKRLAEIIEKTRRFHTVIMTCRSHILPPGQKEPDKTGSRKVYLSPLDQKDIKKYLNKRFPVFNIKKKHRAKQVVRNAPHLMALPLLLSHIDDLAKSKRQYKYTHEAYDELIKNWLEREASHYKEAEQGQFKEEFYEFSRAVAVDIYQHRESREGLLIKPEEIEYYAKKHRIRLDRMEMERHSLLNRNAAGDYQFSHRSIFEYFLALELLKNQAFKEKFRFEGMEQSRRFYKEIIDMSKEYTARFFKQENLRKAYRQARTSDVEPISRGKPGKFAHVEYLNLSNRQLADTGVLKEFSGLKFLHLEHNLLTGIDELKRLRELKSLYINDNQLSDISPLRELRELIVLNVANNRLTDIRVLRKLKMLEVLILNDNRVTDIGVLKEMKKLWHLNIRNNPVPPEQIAALKQILPKCEIHH